MKLAFYGNNLNMGYFFIKWFREYGIEAKLLCGDYPYEQEQNHWWTDRDMNSELVKRIGVSGSNTVCTPRRLLSLPEVRAAYEAVRGYDILMMAEDGPALFSELDGIKKVFLSFGSDLQHMPFMVSLFWSLGLSGKRSLGAVLRGKWRVPFHTIMQYIAYRQMESRQVKGLRQCDVLICTGGHQQALIHKLGLEQKKVFYLPIPMDPGILEEINSDGVQQLRQKYSDSDILFFHPTRQFYLKTDNNLFLKDNNKLLYAYADFVKTTTKNVKLLLLEKGREADLTHSKLLVKRLNLEAHVEWLPEMPNKKLRAYYQLEHLVVCDQYSPNIAMLGNIGREATYYGKVLITAFKTDWNRMLYGDDMPPNVFPATLPHEILAAMKEVSGFSRKESEKRSKLATEWFSRNLHKDTVVPRYINLLLTLLEN